MQIVILGNTQHIISIIFARLHPHCHHGPTHNRFTLTGYIPLTLLNLSYIIDGDRSRDESCSVLSSLVTTLVVPVSIAGFCLRSWRLLFLFQTTSDLALNSSKRLVFRRPQHNDEHSVTLNHSGDAPTGGGSGPTPGGATSGTHTPSGDRSAVLHLSWYSRHRHYMRWRWLFWRTYAPLFLLGSFIWIGSIVGQGSTPCNKVDTFWISVQLLWCIGVSAGIAVAIIRISCKLSHFGRDSLVQHFDYHMYM